MHVHTHTHIHPPPHTHTHSYTQASKQTNKLDIEEFVEKERTREGNAVIINENVCNVQL